MRPSKSPIDPIADYHIIPVHERRQVLETWNRTGKIRPPQASVQQHILARAEQMPDRTALVWDLQDRDRLGQFSYEYLDRQSAALAAELSRLGAGPDRPVAICCGRTPGLITAILAVLRTGSAYLPLDPSYPEHRLAATMADAKVGIIVTETATENALPKTPATAVLADRERAGSPPESHCTATQADHLSHIIYTSGSTGRPKGVAIRHGATAILAAWMGAAFERTAFTSVFASTSICFDLSVFEILGVLVQGGKIVLGENALHLADHPARHEVRLINTVPSAMRELLRIEAVPAAVRVVNLAGEPLRGSLVRQIYRETSVQRVLNLYGPSEDTTYTTFTHIDPRASREPTIGRPIAQTRVYLVDRRGFPVPIGVPGELWISGSGLARGYLGRPAMTAERFIPNPFATDTDWRSDTRIYRSGDLARYLPDGQLHFLGRKDHQIKLRGFRIELNEIEALLNRHARVSESIAIVRADQSEDASLIAYYLESAVEVDSGHEPERNQELELRTYLQQRLPAYMVPAQLMRLAAWPLTPNGKIDRKQLPRPGKLARQRKGVPPRNDVERSLAEIWSDILDRKDLGIHDNFFELGGHSLKATMVIAQTRKKMACDIRLKDLFLQPTIASLANLIGDPHRSEAGKDLTDSTADWSFAEAEPDPDNLHQPFELTDVQQAYWVGRNADFEMGDVATHGYLETGVDHFDPARFTHAWQMLIQRHPMLRAIVTEDGQ